MSGGGSRWRGQGGGGGGRGVQHAAVRRRRAVAHLLRGQVLHALFLASDGEVCGQQRKKMTMNYGSDVGCKSGSGPSKLQTCDIKKKEDGGRKISDFMWRLS